MHVSVTQTMETPLQWRTLAHLFECVARGLNLQEVLKSEETVNEYKNEFEKLVGNLTVFKSKLASSKWNKVFREKLSCAIMVVPSTVSELNKSSIRGPVIGCCMGCGSNEHTHTKAISLFGCLPVQDDYHPFRKMHNLEKDYAEFIESYNGVINMAPQNHKCHVHPDEGGMFVLGETCHNRALAYNIAENFVCNWIFIAEQYIATQARELAKRGKKLDPKRFYISFEEDAQEINKSFLLVQHMATKETGDVSMGSLALDQFYIKSMTKLRHASYLDKTQMLTARADNFYCALGMIGRAPWGHYNETGDVRGSSYNLQTSKAVATHQTPVGLFDALKAHVDASQSDSESEVDSVVDSATALAAKSTTGGGSSSETVGVALQATIPLPLSKTASKRPIAVAQKSNATDLSTAYSRASKRTKLVDHLEQIKERLKRSGHIAEALAIMEAVVEIQK